MLHGLQKFIQTSLQLGQILSCFYTYVYYSY